MWLMFPIDLMNVFCITIKQLFGVVMKPLSIIIIWNYYAHAIRYLERSVR